MAEPGPWEASNGSGSRWQREAQLEVTLGTSSADSGSWAGRARAAASPHSTVIGSKEGLVWLIKCYLYHHGCVLLALLVLTQKQRRFLLGDTGPCGSWRGEAGALCLPKLGCTLTCILGKGEWQGGGCSSEHAMGGLLLLHMVALVPPAPRGTHAVAGPPRGAPGQFCWHRSPEWAEPGCRCLGAAAPTIPAGSWQTMGNGLGMPRSPPHSVKMAACLPWHVQERVGTLHADTHSQKRAAGPRVLSVRGHVPRVAWAASRCWLLWFEGHCPSLRLFFLSEMPLLRASAVGWLRCPGCPEGVQGAQG